MLSPVRSSISSLLPNLEAVSKLSGLICRAGWIGVVLGGIVLADDPPAKSDGAGKAQPEAGKDSKSPFPNEDAPEAKPAAPKKESKEAAPATTPGAPPVTPPARVELSQRQLYQLAMKTSVLIVIYNSEGKALGNGSGWVLDKKRKLVMTNSHVMAGYRNARVYFPEYEEKRLITEKDHYFQPSKGIVGDVLYDDPSRDLAVLQLERMPETCVEATLAPESPTPGEMLNSVGNPGSSNALWVYTSGTVRQVYKTKQRKDKGADFEGVVIETQSPINPGDSGGMVTNDQGQVVGTVMAYMQEARLVTLFIDISEIQKVRQQLNDVLDPKTVDQFVLRGKQYLSRGDFEKALGDFSAALKIDPKHAMATAYRGECFAKRGDPDSAMADFEEAIKLDPHCAHAYMQRGSLLIDKGKWDPLIQDMTKLIRTEPTNDLAYFYRALGQNELNNLESAVNDVSQAIRNNPRNHVYWRVRGDFYRRGGLVDKAINDYLESIKIAPRDQKTYISLGDVLLFNKKDYGAAIKVFSTVIENDPSNSVALVERARAYWNQDQLELSMADLNKAEKLAPNNPSVYDFRGDIFLARREYQKALTDYLTAVKIDGRNAVYVTDAGIAYAEMNQNNDALRHFNEAIQLNSKYAPAYLRRAIVLYKLGEKERSADDEKTAKSLNSQYANVDIGTRFTRFIRVTNALDEDLKVYMQYRTKTVNGDWAWFPSEPGSDGDVMVFTIPAKRTLFLARNDLRIHAATIRIWGKGVQSEKLITTHRDKDLFIAPEAGYVTAEPQNFDYTFVK